MSSRILKYRPLQVEADLNTAKIDGQYVIRP